MMCVVHFFLIQILTGFLTITCATGENSNSVGVIDLRPKLSSDRIYLNAGIGKAIFPPVNQSADDSDPIYDDDTFDLQAAAAQCIGEECSTVFLMIAYDFEHGKTVLHRAFGGRKLMSFVDGTRKFWETKRTKTKLIVLLLPSSTSSENQLQSFLSSTVTNNDETRKKTDMHDLTNIKESSMLKGAKILIERLRSCFEYGGEKFRDLEIFQDAEIICADSNLDTSDDVDDMVLNQHGERFSLKKMPSDKEELFEHLKQRINSSYKSASGSGNVDFIL
jgi:hypothetical protein